ncbi:hypothetical protein DFH09DRAFT_132647 [Mycena vulgaris]|nr:hypothetical protein DFH09DRAFT_132647 [Mycena vulgaris]
MLIAVSLYQTRLCCFVSLLRALNASSRYEHCRARIQPATTIQPHTHGPHLGRMLCSSFPAWCDGEAIYGDRHLFSVVFWSGSADALVVLVMFYVRFFVATPSFRRIRCRQNAKDPDHPATMRLCGTGRNCGIR